MSASIAAAVRVAEAGGSRRTAGAEPAACAGRPEGATNPARLYDMHCHLDFLPSPRVTCEEAACLGIGAFSVTVTPRGYLAARALLEEPPLASVRLGMGAHPWWVGDGRVDGEQLDLFEELAPQVAYVGEVGLDLGLRHKDSREAQLAALRRIARACGRSPGKLLSLHAVRAADAVLDVLESSGCLPANRCVMHWFSCSSDELQRAIRAGCYFSINPRMLATKRGRAYVRAIPKDRLLLETDEPPERDATLPCRAWLDKLEQTLARIEELRGEPLRETIAQTSARLLGLAT